MSHRVHISNEYLSHALVAIETAVTVHIGNNKIYLLQSILSKNIAPHIEFNSLVQATKDCMS